MMSCDDSEQFLDKVMPPDPEQKALRKRKKDESSWKRNKIKAARQAGLRYVNYRGKEIPQKKPRLGKTLRGNKCRYSCSQKISDNAKKSIFSSLYSLLTCARVALLREQFYAVNCLPSCFTCLILHLHPFRRYLPLKFQVVRNRAQFCMFWPLNFFSGEGPQIFVGQLTTMVAIKRRSYKIPWQTNKKTFVVKQKSAPKTIVSGRTN